MWPFSKRSKDQAPLPSVANDDDRWALLEGEYDGNPLLVRLNSSAKAWQGNAQLNIKLGFAIPLNSPNPGGLPEPEENEQLSDIEEAILEEVDAVAQGVNALVITTGTMREIIFYIAPGPDIATLHKKLQHRIKTHEVQCMAVKDPRWDAYQQFAPE